MLTPAQQPYVLFHGLVTATNTQLTLPTTGDFIITFAQYSAGGVSADCYLAIEDESNMLLLTVPAQQLGASGLAVGSISGDFSIGHPSSLWLQSSNSGGGSAIISGYIVVPRTDL